MSQTSANGSAPSGSGSAPENGSAPHMDAYGFAVPGDEATTAARSACCPVCTRPQQLCLCGGDDETAGTQGNAMQLAP